MFFLRLFPLFVIAQAYIGDEEYANRQRILLDQPTQVNSEFIANFDCGSKKLCKTAALKLKRLANKFCFNNSNTQTEIDMSSLTFLTFTCENSEVLNTTRFQYINGFYVEYEPNYYVGATSNWGLDRIDQFKLPLDHKTFYSDYTGYGVTIYIVDTGINSEHDEFRLTGHNSRAVIGGDFVREQWVEDQHGHGSHCAGVAAGKTFGVAKGARVVGIKALSRSGIGSIATVIGGINWALEHKGNNTAVLSLSIGGPKSDALDKAVQAAAKEGMIVVVAAGNNGKNACKYSPARAGGKGKKSLGVITVGATTENDLLPKWSNFGPCVDIYAPGLGIESVYKGSTTATATMSGTSMATPHVAGVAALLLEKHQFDRAKAQTELFQYVSKRRIKNLKRGSRNILLRVPEPRGYMGPKNPTPYPTYGPISLCLEGKCYDFKQSSFGSSMIGDVVQGELVAPSKDLCTPFALLDQFQDKIVLLPRIKNSCTFFVRVLNAQKSGARAVIFYSDQKGAIFSPVYKGDDVDQIEIPSVMISKKDGKYFRNRLGHIVKFGSI